MKCIKYVNTKNLLIKRIDDSSAHQEVSSGRAVYVSKEVFKRKIKEILDEKKKEDLKRELEMKKKKEESLIKLVEKKRILNIKDRKKKVMFLKGKKK